MKVKEICIEKLWKVTEVCTESKGNLYCKNVRRHHALTALADVQSSKFVVNKANMSPRLSFSDASGRPHDQLVDFHNVFDNADKEFGSLGPSFKLFAKLTRDSSNSRHCTFGSKKHTRVELRHCTAWPSRAPDTESTASKGSLLYCCLFDRGRIGQSTVAAQSSTEHWTAWPPRAPDTESIASKGSLYGK